MEDSPLKGMMDPASVAVIGASETPGSVGAQVFANLTGGGFAGDIYPVNPRRDTVGGLRSYRSATAIGKDIDLAVIAAPARTVPGIIRDCGEAGIRNAVILSPGFDEDGSGQKPHGDLRAIAARAGVRFMGPNCVGLVRPWHKMNATILPAGTPKGRLALISQSGALCSAISDWAGPHHLGFSALVSLGNSIDIDFGDMLQYLASDPHTDAILLYVEGVRDAKSFISSLRYAARLKPVIVLKSGRHARSGEAAHTHTGALIGSDAVFDAVLERAGAVRAMTFGQLFAAAEILSSNRKATGNRLSIITNGGGAGVLAADRAADLNVALPALEVKTVAALDKALPGGWSHANPIDIRGDAGPAAYGAAVKAAHDDPNYDGVLVLLTPQIKSDPEGAAQAVVDALPKRRRKPVLACWMGEASVAEGRRLLSANGVADFISPERAVEAFSYLAKHHRNRKLALEVLGPLSPTTAPDLDGARLIIQAALADDREMLSDLEAKAVLKAFRIPINVTFEAESATEALVAASSVGFPVAMKISSPDITHKSDVGGVRTGIGDAAEVKRVFRDICDRVRRERPGAQIKGVTVEAMANIEAPRELVIGASRDPVFGPTILFGAGGTAVEVLADNAVALPPLNAVLANRLISRTRVSRLLAAYRDMPAADREAVIFVLRRISMMVSELPEIVELDLNPLIAGSNGVLAVDARIRVARPPARDGLYDHMAIHPYPRHLIRQEHLSDGTPLIIRPIRPEDAESEQKFVKNLSEEARMFRFMGVLNELSPEMLVQFTQIDYRREMALVAMAEIDGEEVQCGVARYVINPDGRSAEFAVVVGDQVQHQGIGTRLMKGLFRAARDHELTTIEGTVLRNNAPMLKLMSELGFTTRRDPDDAELVIVERAL
ncbi:bifunctional acetate--CoA ligase family protein/GNAT family N-acetyltransferase [Maritimibacter sp. UBA3975]|uniref:bifunctional acetate--CoA ligase family protein/GNAT family N-acetyltransferase n=1 Tax=Maritimibacter sp. UBA3975 TaxID=1946833 RepID=UPI000C09E9A6|nr:bifunctional acetate--CoA ligase family protein/GNAT family N-acetyltransferase [Maritimibacter sp. UBA3975]MAM63121.1 GNAT family N-acetyltransferase [Maritimibacter sp.]|tara:strand:- start:17718 stop:20396 length:2679 start_codon:yes stop_codon:yes gene_type:complete